MTKEREDYLIFIPRYGWNGLYWKNKGQGYTSDLFQAGLFTKSYAERVASNPDPHRKELAVPLKDKKDELQIIRNNTQRLLDLIEE